MTDGGAGKVGVGALVERRGFGVVGGGTVEVPGGTGLTHLQFRRFAGCPICNLHLRSFARRHAEIAAAGVREVVFFHSSEAELLPHVRDLPFAVVADPALTTYREFGVESGRRALLDPRVWPTIVRGVAVTLSEIARGRKPSPSPHSRGGRFGLPADFLIAADGRVPAVKYGVHASDQWSVEELLERAWERGRVG